MRYSTLAGGRCVEGQPTYRRPMNGTGPSQNELLWVRGSHTVPKIKVTLAGESAITDAAIYRQCADETSREWT